MPLILEQKETKQVSQVVRQAQGFRGAGKFGLEEKPIPRAGVGEAVIHVHLATIRGRKCHSISAGLYRCGVNVRRTRTTDEGRRGV